MRAHPSIRHFPGLWLPARQPSPQERVRFDQGFARELGLVGAWILNASSPRDLSAVDNHARPVGASIRPVATRSGIGYLFPDGANNHRLNLGTIASDNPLSLSQGNTGSIVSRARVDDLSGGGSFPRIFDKSDSGGGANGYQLCIDNRSSQRHLMVQKDGGFTWESSVDSVNATGWYDFAALIDGQEAAFYINQVFDSEPTVSGAGLDFSSTTTNAALGNWNHSTDRIWSGAIEYVYVFDSRLSAAAALSINREPYRYLEAEPAAAVVFLPRAVSGGGGATVDVEVIGHYYRTLLAGRPSVY